MSLRDLPSVDSLAQALGGTLPRSLVVEVARSALEEARAAMRRGAPADPLGLARPVVEALERARPQEVVNATGVLLHTNLGRAPLHPLAAEAARRAAEGYSNLELDLATGERGRRAGYLHRLLTDLTGSESALVVNNNAAALLLALSALAAGHRVPVSRGELIEIGGSYRLPELMAASGAQMVEVGTTNRTRLDDYRQAVDEDTALVLKVHPSNYRITGFTEEVEPARLAAMCREVDVPLVHDVGSGLLDARTPWLAGPPPAWLAGEPGVRQSLEAGASLVLFSGDKLLGGPQAGIVVGHQDLILRMRRHPVARALRPDGPTIAALSSTLERYADGSAGELPLWRMASLGWEELEERSRRVIERSGVRAEVVPGASTPGAGSVPGSELPGPVIRVPGDADRRFLSLLTGRPPVLARRDAGGLVLDLRAVPPELDATVAGALGAACRS